MSRSRVLRLGCSDHEYPAWRRWMRNVAAVRARYHGKTGLDPLAVSEASAVGLLLSAAGASGLLGLLEYPTDKRAANERGWCYGRCDLWVTALRHADHEGWAFEVKHQKLTSKSTAEMLTRPYRAAWHDAGALLPSEGSKRIACVVYSTKSDLDPGCVAMRTLDRLAAQSHVAWRLSGENLPPAFILFRLRKRGAVKRAPC